MKNIVKVFSKKRRIIYGLIGFGLSVPAIAFATPGIVINTLTEIIFKFFLWPVIHILKLELWIMPKIASYNNFTREAGVEVGWTAVRDLTNTFFILILLIIAFATILRISSYGYKQLLSRLLIVAILVNFSMTIVGLGIDISQIVMLTFLDSVKDITAGNIMTGLGLENAFSAAENQPDVNQEDIIASVILAGIMLTITVVIIGAFIAMLAMRIVMLWISLILSPAAFVAFVFPSAKKYYNQWSLDLGKNLVTGPALMFFLWLSFTIIKGLDIRQSMGVDPEGDALESFSQVSSTGNVVSYVIGTALLLAGLQFAAKSGAAGSGIMGKASSKINSTASSLGKRYVGGLASRAGYLASKGIINEKDGSMRRLGGLGTIAGKVPFWGGRLQRSAQKMQGYEAQRISGIQVQDEKYIKSSHKSQFHGSQATMFRESLAENENDSKGKAGFKKAGRWLGKGYSTVTSFGGGDYERNIMQDMAQLKRGDINVGNAQRLTNSARTIGDEESMQRVQAQYMTFKDEGEVNRLLEKGLPAVMSCIKGGAIQKENGEITKGGSIWASALGKHFNTDPNAMLKLGMTNDKEDRWAGFQAIKADLHEKGPSSDALVKDKDGHVQTDKKKILGLNLSSLKNFLGTLKIYPQNAADEHNEKTGEITKVGAFAKQHAKIDNETVTFTPGTVAAGLSQMPYETNKEFVVREKQAKYLDNMDFEDKSSLPDHLQDEENLDVVENYRQQKYREAHMLTWETDIEGDHVIDPYAVEDTGEENGNRVIVEKFNPQKRARYEVTFMGQGFAKESEADFATRQREAGEETDGEYKERIDDKMQKINAVDSINNGDKGAAKGMSDDELKRYKLRKKRIIAGDQRANNDLITKTFWTEAWDGGDGDRFNELDQSKQGQQEISQSAAPFMNKHNINQGWPGGESDQSTALAMYVTGSGHAPTKPQIENLGHKVSPMQRLADVNAHREGHYVNEPDVVGPIHYADQGENPVDPLVGKTISTLQKGDVIEQGDGTRVRATEVDNKTGNVSFEKLETIVASLAELGELTGKSITTEVNVGDILKAKDGGEMKVTGQSSEGFSVERAQADSANSTSKRELFDDMHNYRSADIRDNRSNVPGESVEAPAAPVAGGAGQVGDSDGSPQRVIIDNADEIASAVGSTPLTRSSSSSRSSTTSRSSGSSRSRTSRQSGTGFTPAERRANASRESMHKKTSKGIQVATDAASRGARVAGEARDEAKRAKDAAGKPDKPDYDEKE